MIHHGDCLEVMAGMDAESIDAIVTDPPYGLEFMGKEWDSFKASGVFAGGGKKAYGNSPGYVEPPRYIGGNGAQEFHERWAEAAYRVAKPSAYLLAFGGTRTVHRMTVALEDAGWIIRDMLVWGYASGFPKGRANLKPAWEPIVMARKPGPLRPLAIDECRIGTDDTLTTGGVHYAMPGDDRQGAALGMFNGAPNTFEQHPAGRWPANVILTDPIFDGGIEGVVGGGEVAPPKPERVGLRGGTAWHGMDGFGSPDKEGRWPADPGGTYSRFFLIPKAARSDREPVLGGLATKVVNITEGHGRGPINTSKGDGTGIRENRARANVHPTVKPTDLMRHLVRLVTPQGGTVLDPFLGSGTTGLAAEMEGFDWIGIEREAEYVAIAEARLNGTQKGMAL